MAQESQVILVLTLRYVIGGVFSQPYINVKGISSPLKSFFLCFSFERGPILLDSTRTDSALFFSEKHQGEVTPWKSVWKSDECSDSKHCCCVNGHHKQVLQLDSFSLLRKWGQRIRILKRGLIIVNMVSWDVGVSGGVQFVGSTIFFFWVLLLPSSYF